MFDVAGEMNLVPKSQDELDLIIQLKPDYWEYRVFGGALMLELSELEMRYEDYVLGYAPRRGVAVYEAEFFDFLIMQVNELQALAASFTRLFNTEASGRAFGAPGTAGDVGRILHLAKRYVGIYDELLLWTERLRGTAVPRKYQRLISILVKYSDQPIQEIRRFVAAYAEKVESIPRRLENASDFPVVIEHRVKWSIPDQVSREYHAELDRLNPAK